MPLALALIAALTSAAAPRPRPSDGPADLVEKAYSAAEEKRFCDAVPLFLSLHERAPQAKHLYRAAEVAYAAGDLAWAQDLYRSVKESYPSFDKSAAVDARLVELARRIERDGSTVVCPAPATVCGDWLVRPGEQCDDGNTVDDDGCDGNCMITACGNGRRAGIEECDDGNLDDGDGCDGTCTRSRCGNGITAGEEQCDDGNAVDGDGCDSNCTKTGCGNGVQTRDEQCDDGNDQNGDGCDRNCTITMCGNGARDPGEECDDANATDGDGCDRGCVASRCGNGIVAGGELCDDGNTRDGDGCSATCKPPGAAVATAPEDYGWVAVALLGAGAAVTAVSGALIAVGAIPLVEHASAVQQIEAAEARISSDPEGALDDARTEQRRARAANDAWQGFGAPLFFGGIGTGVLGLAVVSVGGLWLLEDDETPPPASAADEERVP